MKLKNKAIALMLGLSIVAGGVGAYGWFQNQDTAQGKVVRNIVHGIEVNITPANDMQDQPLLPGDSFDFTITAKNKANYAQDIDMKLALSGLPANVVEYAEDLSNCDFELAEDRDDLFLVKNVAPGETKSMKVTVKVKTSATKEDLPGISTQIVLDAVVNGIQSANRGN